MRKRFLIYLVLFCCIIFVGCSNTEKKEQEDINQESPFYDEIGTNEYDEEDGNDDWYYYDEEDGNDDGYYYDDYGDFDVNETGNSTQISESEIKNINYSEVITLMTKWQNDYNKNNKYDAQIGRFVAKTLVPKIEYSGSCAVVTTEVEYWFRNKGGSASGSVYVTITIDLNSRKVISSFIS